LISDFFCKIVCAKNKKEITFLLPMNEVNKYCFSNLIFFFIDFLEDLGLFTEEIPIFLRKKKIRRSAVWRDFMAVQMKFVHPIFERRFQVRDFSFWITEGIGLTGVCFYL
jgi:hypothetical protein